MHVVTLSDLNPVAQRILQRTPRVVALVGPLGAGKTTLTQAIAHVLHVPGAVTSPTYVLQQVYPANHPAYTTLVHVDAYRLRGEHELPALDLLHWGQQPHTLIVVEWADRIRKFLEPFAPVWVTLRLRPDGSREVTVS